MLPDGFPLFPASVPDISVPLLLLSAVAMLVVMLVAFFVLDQWQRRQEAPKGAISEMPPRAKKAA